MILHPANELIPQLKGKHVDLYLDYDGTLAPFAPTPDDVLPDESVIGLISQLADSPNVRVSIVSGRRLGHIRKLLPINGILLAGTYGVELRCIRSGGPHCHREVAFRRHKSRRGECH